MDAVFYALHFIKLLVAIQLLPYWQFSHACKTL